MAGSYHEEQKQKITLQIRDLLINLPPFLSEFFRGLSNTTAPRSRMAYAYDLRIFFNYLVSEHTFFITKKMEDITLNDIMHVTPDDLEKFLEYITYYTKPAGNAFEVIELQNDERGKARKLAAIRSMYMYFYKKRKIPSNPAELVDLPKIHEKAITRLEISEVVRLLDVIESGEYLTEHQQRFHKYTKVRDLAIVSVLLGTGIRVSECVGINISDVDFNLNGVKITRKGGDEVVVYFGDEVREALLDYLAERKKTIPPKGHEEALFLSLQNKRITVRSIQNLVKKYSSFITKIKNISPHKLRSTYGTNLYRETGDIYLVADVLGHKDVNTTRKYYAQIDDDRRKEAAKHIWLRKK